MNIKKVLITLLLIHVLAFILTACGGKKNNGNGCIPDMYGNCQSGPIFGNPQAINFPFYPNAAISNPGQFKRFMNSEYGIYAKCLDYFSSDCRGLQVLVQHAGGSSYNVVLRGLAVNRGINIWAGDSYFNNQAQNMSSTVNFHAVAQAYKTNNGKVIVRLQQSTFNAYNSFAHYNQEHTLNHVYLETDGVLSQSVIRFVMYYNNGKSGGALPIASGTLVKGRDIL